MLLHRERHCQIAVVLAEVRPAIVHTITRVKESKTYTLKNRSEQDRTVLIEHPYRSDFHLTSAEKPLERAEAFFGLGEVEFFRRPPVYKKSIQHYDEALDALGYDPLGHQRNQNQTAQPAAANDFKERASFYLREKGELYQVWGDALDRQGNPLAARMYNNALGFYRLAKGFGGSGVAQANEGIAKARESLGELNAKSETEVAQQPKRALR